MPRAEQQTPIGGGGASTPLLAPEQQLDASVAVRLPQAAAPDSPVAQWLASHHLGGYAEAVIGAGYDSLLALSAMTDADRERLATAAKMKRPHARAFATAIASLRGNATPTAGSPVATVVAAAPATVVVAAPAASPVPSVEPLLVMAQPVITTPAQSQAAAPPTSAAAAAAPCSCIPRCKSQLIHQRLAQRAAVNGCTLATQRSNDKFKRDQEIKCAGIWTGLSLVSLYIILQNTYCVPQDVCPCSEFDTCPGMVGCPTPIDAPCDFPPLSSCGKTQDGMVSCFSDGNAGTVIMICGVALIIKIVIYLRCMRVCCRTQTPPWDTAIDQE